MTGTTIETAIRIMSRWGKLDVVRSEKDGFVDPRPQDARDDRPECKAAPEQRCATRHDGGHMRPPPSPRILDNRQRRSHTHHVQHTAARRGTSAPVARQPDRQGHRQPRPGTDRRRQPHHLRLRRRRGIERAHGAVRRAGRGARGCLRPHDRRTGGSCAAGQRSCACRPTCRTPSGRPNRRACCSSCCGSRNHPDAMIDPLHGSSWSAPGTVAGRAVCAEWDVDAVRRRARVPACRISAPTSGAGLAAMLFPICTDTATSSPRAAD